MLSAPGATSSAHTVPLVIATCGDDVTERLTHVTVKITSKKLVYCSSLGAVTVYTKLGQFGYLIIPAIATVHYLYTVRLLHMQQPHHCLLTVVSFTPVPSSRNKAYSMRLRKCLRRTLFQADAIDIDSRKTSRFPICMNSRRNTRHACLKTVTSS